MVAAIFMLHKNNNTLIRLLHHSKCNSLYMLRHWTAEWMQANTDRSSASKLGCSTCNSSASNTSRSSHKPPRLQPQGDPALHNPTERFRPSRSHSQNQVLCCAPLRSLGALALPSDDDPLFWRRPAIDSTRKKVSLIWTETGWKWRNYTFLASAFGFPFWVSSKTMLEYSETMEFCTLSFAICQ